MTHARKDLTESPTLDPDIDQSTALKEFPRDWQGSVVLATSIQVVLKYQPSGKKLLANNVFPVGRSLK